MMARIAVIGSGFSGMSAACYLSAAGHEVHLFEKNSSAGGRARTFKTEEGFQFDMGPSWYWMPDVFERFFSDFGYSTKDFYALEKLQPAFDIFFGSNDKLTIPAEFNELYKLFESIEVGSGDKLIEFMKEGKFRYDVAMSKLIYQPGLSLSELADPVLMRNAFRLRMFSSFSSYIKKYFTHPKLLALMEFPVLFLGAMPQQTPALYSLMNYAGLCLGTWYPKGGFGEVVHAFASVAKTNGVQFHFESTVEKIETQNNQVVAVKVNGESLHCDGIIAAADYHHVESMLMNEQERNYSSDYWEEKTFAPSSLIFYLGLNKKIKSFNHHTLFFDESLEAHSRQIYKQPQWPDKPLFYVCCPSKTDDTVAPAGCENLFFLMPIAAGLEDTRSLRKQYFNLLMDRLEALTGESIRPNIVFKKSYCTNNFIEDYNAFKGNAYGLANTLSQTAHLKPKIKNFKIQNMFYAGQLTVPGPGVPPAIISGKIAAELLMKNLKRSKAYETVV